MAFKANPLSLSVPEPEFESWLRDTGYLEILDQRTSTASTTTTTSATATASATFSSSSAPHPSSSAATTATISYGLTISLFSRILTLLSLFTLNPFSKLTSDDFSGQAPSWTVAFFGSCDSYSFPPSTSQGRLRVHENVKRYARNYATLFIVFFACSLYQMPFALVGLISCLALWDVFKFCGDRWGLDRYPILRQSLIRIAQCATGVILFFSNVQTALFCAFGVSYAVMILHASTRKLSPAKQSAQRPANNRFGRK